MIIAAGLTPAYQQILVFDSLHLGEVNRAAEAHFCASGKSLNVGIALSHLGGGCMAIAPAGGVPGEMMAQEFRALGLPCRWIRTAGPTRMCTTLIDRTAGVITELVENVAPLESGELDEFRRAYEEEVRGASVVVLSGSLPRGTPKTFYRELMAATTAPVILDASGAELLEALPLRPFCVKPNRQELARTLGREVHSEQDLRDAIAETHRLGAEWVLVSNGAKALRASDGSAAWRFIPPRIQLVNPIGSGDCLAAGLAWACREGMDMLEAVRFAIAAAAENAAALLPARLSLERIRARLPEVQMEKA